MQALIKLEGVGKDYPLTHKGGHQLAQVWARLRGSEPTDGFTAVNDIIFEVLRGQ
jgi:hypothetical protein